MGNCGSTDEKFIAHERVANNLRRDLNETTETLKELKSSLTSTPKGKEELEALRLKISTEREIEELKSLIALREEVAKLKQTLGTDPSFVSANIQADILALQQRVDASKALKTVASSVNSGGDVACASLRFDGTQNFGDFNCYRGWRVKYWRENSFTIGADGGIVVLITGLYQIHAVFCTRNGRNGNDRCHILVNGQVWANHKQCDSDPMTSMLVHFALGAGSVITVNYEATFPTNAPRLMPTIDVDINLLCKHEEKPAAVADPNAEVVTDVRVIPVATDTTK